MNDESNRKPGTFNNVPINYNDPWDAVRGDPSAENFHIANMGIKFVHYMCVPDPLYQNSAGDVRHSFGHDDGNQQFVETERFHRENGFIYVRKGTVYGIFQSGSKDMKNIMAGLYNDAGAMVSLNRFYIDTDETIKISENDKLIPCELPSEFFSVNWEKFQHNPTGIDRLEFRACEVMFLIDSDGIQYMPGKDFNVEKGYIRWVDGGDRPGLDKRTGNGKTCAIRYTYQPYYYIKTAIHDIRIRPAIVDGGIQAKKGPILAVLQADWVYLDRRNNDDKDAAQQLDEGSGTNTGPR